LHAARLQLVNIVRLACIKFRAPRKKLSQLRHLGCRADRLEQGADWSLRVLRADETMRANQHEIAERNNASAMLCAEPSDVTDIAMIGQMLLPDAIPNPEQGAARAHLKLAVCEPAIRASSSRRQNLR